MAETDSYRNTTVNRTRTLLAALGAVILAAGCTAGSSAGEQAQKNNAAAEAEIAAVDADARRAAGVWEGVIPAADCPGIRVALYVRATGTYTRIDSYLERNLSTVEDGRWTLKGDRLQLTPLDAKKSVRWAEIEGNKMHLTDMSGKRIEGALAENYVLTRS